MRRMRSGCCARAASGQAVAPPSSNMNSRRFMSNMELPPGLLPRGDEGLSSCSNPQIARSPNVLTLALQETDRGNRS